MADVAPNLTSDDDTAQFYDDRYSSGYMESWPDWKLNRVRALVRELPLPKTGRALDFGCGNGLFTRVLAEALPGWQVCGVDISATAIEQARAGGELAGGVPGSRAQFFVAGFDTTPPGGFDLVFTHHVLEHVLELDAALDLIDSYLAPAASVLHILPCGNAGSFEYGVCQLRTDGVDPERGGRFFFEDEGHLRRLDTDTLSACYTARGFELSAEFYGGQYAAAVQWITCSGVDFVKDFADPAKAVDEDAAYELARLRTVLLRSAYVRWAAHSMRQRLARGNIGPLAAIRLLVTSPVWLMGSWLDRYWRKQTEREWRQQRHERNGSEMYLLFSRGADASPEDRSKHSTQDNREEIPNDT